MFIQTYLKFYQEYFKMVCSICKGSFSAIKFEKTSTTFRVIFHDVKNCQSVPFPKLGHSPEMSSIVSSRVKIKIGQS